MRLALRRAERDHGLARNVAGLADIPRGTRRRSKALTLEQIGKLLASDLDPWWTAYLITGILCGLRPREILSLTWNDIDFDHMVIRVRHCLKAGRDDPAG